LTLRGVEIDQLHAREPRELRNPQLGVGRFNRELLALDQLDNPAALKID